MADPTEASLPATSKENRSIEPDSGSAAPWSTASNDASENTVKQDAIPSPLATTEDPPPPIKPPRPLSPQAQAEKTLGEAFPSIDATIVKAVLSASGGAVEPAFDALLGMTDPESQKDARPPMKLTRPVPQADMPTSTAQSQLEADEQYARQLHEHYSGASRQQGQIVAPHQKAPRQSSQAQDDREYSFVEDDLPVIRDNIRKGFLETQSTVNKWVSSFKKKLDGEEEGYTEQPIRPVQGSTSGDQPYPSYNRKSLEMARRSADRERYDADPRVLGDDFSSLELRDTEEPPKKPQRPVANPDLFKSAGTVGGRQPSSGNGPPQKIDQPYPKSPKPIQGHLPAAKPSKWQPLSVVEPSPIADNDPFSLGDSDDDRETRLKDTKSSEIEPAPAPVAAEMIGPTGEDTKAESGTSPGVERRT